MASPVPVLLGISLILSLPFLAFIYLLSRFARMTPDERDDFFARMDRFMQRKKELAEGLTIEYLDRGIDRAYALPSTRLNYKRAIRKALSVMNDSQ